MDDILNSGTSPYISEASVSVEIETEDMTLNIGPQHPSTHGVLRLVAKVDGEKISSVEPVLGYMHRGYEKLAEVRTYPQITTLVNRIDCTSSKPCAWKDALACVSASGPLIDESVILNVLTPVLNFNISFLGIIN